MATRCDRGLLLALVLAYVSVPLTRAEDPYQPPVADSAARSISPAPRPDTPDSLGDLLNLDLEQLGRVTVDPAPQSPRSSGPATVLSADAAELSGASTTGELLKQVPGVSVRRTSALNLDPRVRGYHSEQLGAALNGMTQVKTRIDVDSLFSQVDPGIVRSMEIIDGPYTSLYGPGFAFILADSFAAPRFETPQGHGSSHFTTDSNSRAVYARQNFWGGGADWGVYVSYGVRTANDYRTGDPDSFLVPSSYKKWDGLFSFSRDLNRGARVEFDYLRTDMNDVELPGVVYDLDNSKNDQWNLRYVIQEDRQGPENFALQFWLNDTAYHCDATRESKQRTLYYRFFTLPDYAEYPVNTIGRGRSDTLGLRTLFTLGEIDAPQWTFGADWRRVHQSYHDWNLDPEGNWTYQGNMFGIPHAGCDDVGAFTHVQIPWNESLGLTVGGRLDGFGATVDPRDPVITRFDGPPEDHYYDPGLNEPQYTFGMAYTTAKLRVTDHLTFNAGTAYAMRAPTLAELYSDEAYEPLVRFGNSYSTGQSNLEPERNWQVDLGLAYQTERFGCGLRGFHSLIDDYIGLAPAYLDPSPPDDIDGGHTLGRDFSYFDWRTDIGTPNENADVNQAGYIYTNLRRVTIYGGELFGEYLVRPGLSLGGEMAYLRGTNHHPVRLVNPQMPDQSFQFIGHSEPLYNIYPLTGTLRIRWFQPEKERWSLGFDVRMVAAHRRVATSLSELPQAGFAVFGMNGYYWLTKSLRLTAAIDNLFNRSYAEPNSLIIVDPSGKVVFLKEPGFNLLLGAEWRF